MRVIAIDLGDRRTGLAVGDRVTGITSPVGVIETPLAEDGGRALVDAVAVRTDREVGPADEVAIGLPINMDGTEGPRAKLTRAFAAALAARLGRPIRLVDERRTSAAANERMAKTGLTHLQKKRRRDAIAAAAICERRLAELNNHAEAPPGAMLVRPPGRADDHRAVADRTDPETDPAANRPGPGPARNDW